MNLIQAKFAQFSNWDFTVIYNLPGTLIVNEQPFRDWTVRGTASVSMPLGPKALLFGKPPKDRQRRALTLAWLRSPNHPRLVEQHNHFVVETARQWVVGSESDVCRYAPELSFEHVQRRRELDRHLVFGPHELVRTSS
jgi:hypothetical protein